MEIVDEYFDAQGNLIGVDRNGRPYVLKPAAQTGRPVDSYAGGSYTGTGVHRKQPYGSSPYQHQHTMGGQSNMGALYGKGSTTKPTAEAQQSVTQPIPEKVVNMKLTALETIVEESVKASAFECCRTFYPKMNGLHIFIMAGSEKLVVTKDDETHIKGAEDQSQGGIIIQDDDSLITNLDDGFSMASGGIITTVSDVFSAKVRKKLEELHDQWYGSRLFRAYLDYVTANINNGTFEKIDVAYPMIRLNQDIPDLANVGFTEVRLVDTNITKFKKFLLSCETGVYLIDTKNKTIKRYLGE